MVVVREAMHGGFHFFAATMVIASVLIVTTAPRTGHGTRARAEAAGATC